MFSHRRSMPREILLNAFSMNTVGHVSPGLWTHPRDRSTEYHRLATWTGLAELLERGMFDGLFLADVLGVYDVHRGGPDGALRHAVQLPINDPLLLVSAMAHVTRHLGFGVTANLSWDTPYQLARRFSTLDHLTEGRIGWNIVTGYLASAARAMGAEMAAHDERYDLAEEFMALAYRFWEGSWEEGAAIRDRASGVFADPARVHTIRHAGPHFHAEGIHLCEPSPQRTPLLYQAGTSRAGRAFAGRHAECVFVSGPSVPVIAPRVAALREAGPGSISARSSPTRRCATSRAMPCAPRWRTSPRAAIRRGAGPCARSPSSSRSAGSHRCWSARRRRWRMRSRTGWTGRAWMG
jgi:alkanesulfonate monooxygenase